MDAGFSGGAFPAYTTTELAALAIGVSDASMADRIRAEILRRAKVADGDFSVMTSAERLRFVRSGGVRK